MSTNKGIVTALSTLYLARTSFYGAQGALFMWLGFAVRHVARKVAIGTGFVVAAALSTESGRRAAKVVAKSAKAAGEAAIEEIKAQRKAKVDPAVARGVQ